MVNTTSKIPDILAKYEHDLLSDWVQLQLSAPGRRPDLMSESELKRESAEFLGLVREAAQNGNTDVNSPHWAKVRDMLATVSRTRARQGFTPVETALFVFSFKQPLFDRMRREFGNDSETLAEQIWAANVLVDSLGLYTTELYQKGREELIRRHQQELLELSTPVVKLWDGVLALPLIGTLDSARTQVVMESLLREIMNTGSSIAIIDITGVPIVDTMVAQHLLKTVAAARLMGADCIISGIRPQIAQTIVHLGVELNDVITKASLADAFRIALHRAGLVVRPVDKQG